MLTIIRIETADQLTALAGSNGGVAPLGLDEFTRHAPDGHWVALTPDNKITARCSAWWRGKPGLPGECPGVVGHFAARDGEAAAMVLDHASRALAAEGCTIAIGPMDGTTWRRYRFVTQRGTEPTFFLEPDNPEEYPHWFEAFGFTPLARYYSNLDPDLGWDVSGALRTRLQRSGIGIRTLNPADFTGELERIYYISIASFSHNFLYSPIGRDEFLAMYAKVKMAIQPELVLFAEHHGTPVGFIFAIGDLLNAPSGGAPDTLILKSLAVLPQWNGKGIGPLLMAEATVHARRLGYRRAIHALMHEENRSRALSSHHGEVMREYTLYARRLP